MSPPPPPTPPLGLDDLVVGGDPKRHRSRIDREPPPPSPNKRSRRIDEKADTLLVAHRTRLQHDPSPRDPTTVPQSALLTNAAYFQHDERGTHAAARNSTRQPTHERGWRRDPKDRHHDSTLNRGGGGVRNDVQQKDDKSQAWRHDGYFHMEEANPPLPPPPRRRPAFSEKKMSSDPDNNAKKAATEERGRHDRHFDSHRPERSFAGDRRLEAPRGGRTREGYGGGNYREKEKSSARQGYFRSGDRVNKWKHDLFDEANRSPTQKHEEDQIAKAEALLLSL